MLGRWRTQNAKLLEEERLNEERERSSSDAASPSSDAASPRSPDASAPSTHTPDPPSTPASAPTDTPTVELASTPAAPASTPTTEPPVTPASAASDRPLVEPASAPATPATPTSAQPTPLDLDASTRVQPETPGEAEDAYNSPAAQSDHDRASDPAGGMDAQSADAPAPEDGIRDTPTSATGLAKDLEESNGAPVAVEATSSGNSDTLKTEDDLTITNNSQTCQKDAEMVLKVDVSKETAGEINSGDSERSKIEGSADTQIQQKSVDTLKNSTGTSNEVVKTAGGSDAQIEQKQTILDGNGSELSKNSVKDEQQSSLAERNESLAPNKGNGCQTCAPTHPGTVHCQFGSYMPIQYYVPPPQRPLNGAPPVQTTGAPSRSQSPFETVNYLSQSTLGHCAQRTYGAAKVNRVTGCAVRMVEKGFRLVTAPVVSIFGLWSAPLLCVDRAISRGAREVVRAFACAPRAEEVCCGLLGCECGIPIMYMGEETEMYSKPKQQ